MSRRAAGDLLLRVPPVGESAALRGGGGAQLSAADQELQLLQRPDVREEAWPTFNAPGSLGLTLSETRIDTVYSGTLIHLDAVSADAELTRRSNHALTWAQLQALKSDGRLTVERPRPLKVAQGELDARPALEGLDGSAQFLVLCGSLDDLVPIEEARALVELIGSASAELRIIPGTGHNWSGQEATLAYAAGDFIWRSLRREASKENSPTRERLDDRPSGFNVFVDNLHAQVEEIHAAARANLPSMPADDDDDDDDDATPIESPPVRRLSREAVK